MPVYNGAAFLPEALESVVAQNYHPHEVIVVDDGSTDGSGEAATEFAKDHPDIKVLSRPHRGVAAARNAGIEAASGELIAFLDADDIWESGKLEAQAEILTARPEVDGLFGYMRNFIQSGIERPSWLRADQVENDVRGHSLCTLLVRREVFDQVGLFDPGIQSGEDGDWFFRARDSGIRFEMMERRLLLRRIHQQNLSHDARAVRAGILGAVRSSLKRRQSQDIKSGHSQDN